MEAFITRLTQKKILFVSVLLFMVLTFILPIQDKMSQHLSGFAAFLVNPCQYLVMVFTLMLAVLFSNLKGLRSRIDQHINKNVFYILIYFVEIVTLTLFILGITKIWGTWSTFGLYAITVLLVPILLEDMSKVDALFLGVGAVYVIVALWEMPYQYGLWKFWELPQGETVRDVISQIVFLVPLILLGGTTIAIIVINNFKTLRFHWKLPAIFIAFTIIGFIVRFNTNFWTDLYYDLKTGMWVYTQPNTGMLILSRLTKVSLAVSFLTIFVRTKLDK